MGGAAPSTSLTGALLFHTECFSSRFAKDNSHTRFVNLFFTLVIEKDRLTDLWLG